MKTLFSILVIWFGCAIAWMILGTAVSVRSTSSSDLGSDVADLWGPEIRQGAPRLVHFVPQEQQETESIRQADGTVLSVPRTVTRDVEVNVASDAADVDLDFKLAYRRKGLRWFTTYDVAFGGEYTYSNPPAAVRDVVLHFPLAGEGAMYDEFRVMLVRGNGREEELEVSAASSILSADFRMEPGETCRVKVSYKARGVGSYTYDPTAAGGTTQMKNFSLTAVTNVPNIDFVPGSMSPTRHERVGRGWRGEWHFERMLSSATIGLRLPDRIHPGDAASRITFFAPIGLLFFFFVVALLATASGIRLHPMHYFFFGTGFFAFHLLFSYFVDHLELSTSFIAAAIVSSVLVVSYARLFTGWRFALIQIGLSQLLYLTIFSGTFFIVGFTGLSIAVGAVVTLFVMMQMTGRYDWFKSEQAKGQGAPPNVSVSA